MYKNSRKYGLQGTDAMVFEALIWLSRQTKDGAVKISYSKLAEFSLCGGKKTAERALKRLIGKGLVLQDASGYKMGQNDPVVGQNDPAVGQNDPISKEERTKEENINKKEVVVKKNNNTTATFFDFWKIVSPNGEYKSYEKACEKLWDKMPKDWRQLACRRATQKIPERSPYYYLKDEDFLRAGAAVATKTMEAPLWLDPEEVHKRITDGEVLVFCRRPDGKGFGTVTQADAERFGVEKVREVKL